MPGDIPNDLMPVQTASDIPPDLQPKPMDISSEEIHKQVLGMEDAQHPRMVNFPTVAGGTAELTSDQARRYYQELQPTALNPNQNNPPGTMSNIGHAVLKPFTGIAAMGQHLASGMAADAGLMGLSNALDTGAENSYRFGEQTSPGVGSGLTGLGVGGAELAAGPVGAAAGAANTVGNRVFGRILAEEQGQKAPEGSVLQDIAVGGVEFAFNRLMQTGLSADAAKAVIAKAAPYVGKTAASVGARTAIGGGLNAANQVATNAIEGQSLGTGVIPAAAQGAAMENLGGVIHDAGERAASKFPPKPASAVEQPVTEPPPAAPISEDQKAKLISQQAMNDAFADLGKINAVETPLGEPNPTRQNTPTDIRAKELKDQAMQAASDELDKQNAPPEIPQVPDANKIGEMTTDAQPIVTTNRELTNLRNQLKTGTLEGEAKTTAEQKVDSLAADVQNQVDQYSQKHGDDAGESLLERLMKDEGGGSIVAQRIVQAAAPEARSWGKAIKGAYDTFNRVFGTGLGVGKQEKGVQKRLVSSGSQLDQDRTQLQETLRPARDAMDKMSEQQKEDFVNAVTAGQDSPDPKFQPVADLIRETNNSLKARAKAAGLNTTNWDENWLHFEGEWPNQKPGTGTSLSGPESFKKNRESEDFTDFKKRIAVTGGKLKYDNPVDMYLNGVNELNRSITGRELLLQEQKTHGTVKRIAGGQPLPDGWGRIDDKLSGDKGKAYAVPADQAWKLNKEGLTVTQKINTFRQMRDSGVLKELPPFEPTQTYGEGGDLQSLQRTSEIGKEHPFPEGHTYVDPLLSRAADEGYLAAPTPIADMLNQFTAGGIKNGSLLDKIAHVTRLSSAANFALSAFHASTNAFSNAILQSGQAIDDVVHGQGSMAFKHIKKAINYPGSVLEGSEGRQIYAGLKDDPTMKPVMDAIRESGARAGQNDMLSRTSWQKAVSAYRQGDGLAAGGNFAKAAAGSISDVIMNKLVPNTKMAALMSAAESGISRGLQGEELTKYMQERNQLADNVAGKMIQTNQFRSRVVDNVMKMVFTAPDFARGAANVYGGATIDTLTQLKNAMQGKAAFRPTANQQIVMAHLITHGLAAATIQATMTAVNTGQVQLPTSLKDLWYPKTGKKNSDGSDQRISMPDPLGFAPALAVEGGKAITNRINPLWRAFHDVATNADYRNVQVREGGVGQQIAQSAEHIAGASVPWSVKSAMQGNSPTAPPPSAMERAGSFIGLRPAPSAITQSAAVQLAHSFSPVGGETRTQEQAAHSDARTKLEGIFRRGETPTPESEQGLNRKDINEARIRSRETPGLVEVLKNSSLTTDQAMQVWDAATPDEQKQIRFLVRGKVGRDEKLKPAEKQEYFKRLSAVQQ